MRRKIHELAMLYELEPDLDDMYVEGAYDKKLYAKLSDSLSAGINIYEIDSIDIPYNILVKYGLTEGKKQRIIALSYELQHLIRAGSLIMLIDADYDEYFRPCRQSKYLRRTEYTTPEMYFFNNGSLTELLGPYGDAKIVDPEALYKSISSTLIDLFAIRLALISLKISATLPQLSNNLIKSGNIFNFDRKRYLNALINNNKIYDKGPLIESTSCDIVPLLDNDARKSGHGDDFVDILKWTILNFKGEKAICSGDVIRKLFIAMVPFVKEIRENIART